MQIRSDLQTLIARIEEYEKQRGSHASGTVEASVLEKILQFAPETVNSSTETGCGKTTILLSHLSNSHICYTVDDSRESTGSLPFVRNCPMFNPEHVHFVLGPTQLTMPQTRLDSSLDLALIDGPHGYPFPDLEYYYIYPRLTKGALLIIDDLHIPTIARMYDIIREDEMFEELQVEGKTGFLRRTTAKTFPPTWDRWDEQNYNRTRFPAR